MRYTNRHFTYLLAALLTDRPMIVQQSAICAGLAVRDRSTVALSTDCCAGERSTSSAARIADRANRSNAHNTRISRQSASKRRQLPCDQQVSKHTVQLIL